jgi:hypothetical protein
LKVIIDGDGNGDHIGKVGRFSTTVNFVLDVGLESAIEGVGDASRSVVEVETVRLEFGGVTGDGGSLSECGDLAFSGRTSVGISEGRVEEAKESVEREEFSEYEGVKRRVELEVGVEYEERLIEGSTSSVLVGEVVVSVATKETEEPLKSRTFEPGGEIGDLGDMVGVLSLSLAKVCEYRVDEVRGVLDLAAKLGRIVDLDARTGRSSSDGGTKSRLKDSEEVLDGDGRRKRL